MKINHFDTLNEKNVFSIVFVGIKVARGGVMNSASIATISA